MAIDRDATLKQAEKLLRAGKLDGAIAEYVRLVEDQPQDWNSINALGDLYLRAGKNDQAVEQFVRVADHQFSEGFFPKAAALYKKALKVKPEDEHILMALAEIGERQKKFIDAKQFLRQVAKQRLARGEQRPAAEAILRLGSLEGADFEAKMAAAQAAQQLGDAFRAVELLKDVAHTLEKDKKRPEALRILAEAAELDPFDAELRVKLAREFVAMGQPQRAAPYLSFDTAGDDIELLLALAMIEFAAGRDEDARVATGRVLALAPEREPDIVKIADGLLKQTRIESAFACIDAISDNWLLQGEVPRAVDVLAAFVEHTPLVPALAKLVEIAVGVGKDEVLRDAQGRLVDAYVAQGRGEDARVLAEQLVSADPGNEIDAERLRQAFVLLGEDDPDEAVARVRYPQSEPEPEPDVMASVDLSTDTFNVVEEVTDIGDMPSTPEVDIFVYPENDTPSPSQPAADEMAFTMPVEAETAIPDPPLHDLGDRDDTVLLELTEIDLSSALSGLLSSPPAISLPPPRAASAATPAATAAPAPVPAPEPEPPEAPAEEAAAPDIEDVFAQMRAKTAREQQASAALGQYEQALQFIQQGLDKEAIAALGAAARVPMLRFKAAAQLGRLLIDRGDLNDGVEWLERAAEAPAPTPDEGYELLYELAGALEAQGELARALAILMELDAESEGYRDVRTRIMHLSRVQTGSSRP